MTIIIYFSLLLLIAWILSSIMIWSMRNGISPMPSSSAAKQSILENLPHDIKGEIKELGCGWGTLAIPIAKAFPSNKVIGYETSPFPFYCCKIRKWLSHCDNLHVLKKDFFIDNLNNSGLVVCYLFPAAMEKLKPKLEKELKPGTYVISNTFAVPGWKPIKTLQINDIYHSKVYIYRIDLLH